MIIHLKNDIKMNYVIYLEYNTISNTIINMYTNHEFS